MKAIGLCIFIYKKWQIIHNYELFKHKLQIVLAPRNSCHRIYKLFKRKNFKESTQNIYTNAQVKPTYGTFLSGFSVSPFAGDTARRGRLAARRCWRRGWCGCPRCRRDRRPHRRDGGAWSCGACSSVCSAGCSSPAGTSAITRVLRPALFYLLHGMGTRTHYPIYPHGGSARA